MKFIIGVIVFLFSTLSFGADRECTCYASGYAYSYEENKYYHSDVVKSATFKAQGSCLKQSTYAENEWNDFFKYEVPNDYKYTTGVFHSCGYSDKAAKSEHSVTKRSRSHKSEYRNKEYYIRRLKRFSVSG